MGAGRARWRLLRTGLTRTTAQFAPHLQGTALEWNWPARCQRTDSVRERYRIGNHPCGVERNLLAGINAVSKLLAYTAKRISGPRQTCVGIHGGRGHHTRAEGGLCRVGGETPLHAPAVARFAQISGPNPRSFCDWCPSGGLPGRKLLLRLATAKICCLRGHSRSRRVGRVPSVFLRAPMFARAFRPAWFSPQLHLKMEHLRKGDREWQSTMWRLSVAVRAVTLRRSVQGNSA